MIHLIHIIMLIYHLSYVDDMSMYYYFVCILNLDHVCLLFPQKMMLSFHEEEEGLPDSFLSNFPSLIKVDIHAKVTDPSVAKSMMGCLLSSLKANGRS